MCYKIHRNIRNVHLLSTMEHSMEEVIDEKTGEKRKPTPDEVMAKCLDQEILNKIEV